MNSELKKLRVSKQYSLKELSRRSGLSITYLSDLENGYRRNPSLNTVEKIAKGLNEDMLKIYYIIKEMLNI